MPASPSLNFRLKLRLRWGGRGCVSEARPPPELPGRHAAAQARAPRRRAPDSGGARASAKAVSTPLSQAFQENGPPHPGHGARFPPPRGRQAGGVQRLEAAVGGEVAPGPWRSRSAGPTCSRQLGPPPGATGLSWRGPRQLSELARAISEFEGGMIARLDWIQRCVSISRRRKRSTVVFGGGDSVSYTPTRRATCCCCRPPPPRQQPRQAPASRHHASRRHAARHHAWAARAWRWQPAAPRGLGAGAADFAAAPGPPQPASPRQQKPRRQLEPPFPPWPPWPPSPRARPPPLRALSRVKSQALSAGGGTLEKP